MEINRTVVCFLALTALAACCSAADGSSKTLAALSINGNADYPARLREFYEVTKEAVAGRAIGEARQQCIDAGWSIQDEPSRGRRIRFLIGAVPGKLRSDLYLELIQSRDGSTIETVCPVLITSVSIHIDEVVKIFSEELNPQIQRLLTLPELRGFALDAPVVKRLVTRFTTFPAPASPIDGLGYQFTIELMDVAEIVDKSIDYWAFSGKDAIVADGRTLVEPNGNIFMQVKGYEASPEVDVLPVFIKLSFRSGRRK